MGNEDIPFKEKIKTIGVLKPSRKSMSKTNVDDHGTHRVEVKEHWNDRVDVTVKPPTVKGNLRG